MRRIRLSWRWGLAIAGSALVLGCAAMSGLLILAGHHTRYLEAKQRWQTQAPAHYLVTIASGPTCSLQAEIRDEQLERLVRQDSCLHPARTVTDLFALIDRGQLSESCFFAGCACRMDVVTYAKYDSTYGYPITITMRHDRAANWWTRGFWRYTVERGRLPDCVRTSEAPVIDSVSLIPLSQ